MVIIGHLLHIGKNKKLFCFYCSNNDLNKFRNNCQRETLKVIRSYYSKPYFLPPSLGQTLMGNWFLVSVNFHKRINRLHKVRNI